jgi:hypothetical protein
MKIDYADRKPIYTAIYFFVLFVKNDPDITGYDVNYKFLNIKFSPPHRHGKYLDLRVMDCG